ncbi:hypothetical protein CVR98_25270, partial [Salmonella enterica subsp. enterica serovar Enteritidis]
MYTSFTSEDSTNPSDYNWTFIKGQDGEQGIQEPEGEDGQTSYLHIAYANSEDGTTGFSTTDSVNKLYIGQYTDFTQEDSVNPENYSWTKIKWEQGDRGLRGLQGPKGDQGIQGPEGETSYTHIAYATDEEGTNF